MVLTRSQTLTLTSPATTVSKSTYKENKQSRSTTRSRAFDRTKKRPPSSSPLPVVHQHHSQSSKINRCTSDTNDAKSFTNYGTTRCTRFSSSDSSFVSSTNSSRSSSSDSSSTSSTDSSCSLSSNSSSTNSSRSSSCDSSTSFNSNTTKRSTANPPSSEFPAIAAIIKDIHKMNINDANNPLSSVDISLSEESDHLPEDGLITVYKSTKNTDFLCLYGYTYQINRRMKNGIKWKCKLSRNKTKCGAKIYTTENIGTDQMPAYKYLQSNNVHHSHDSDHDQQKVATFISQLKDVGRSNRTLPPSKIINQLATSMKLSDTQLGMIPRQGTLYQRVYRARSKTIPPIPTSTKFDIPIAFSTTSSDEEFIFFDHLYCKEAKRIIACASPMQLKKLFTAKLICVDGTFSICPRKYKQLLIIQTIDKQKYDATPVLYALLNDKKARTYRLLFQALKCKAEEMKMKFEPDRIISDFESGMISTIKSQFPRTIHQGCLFHLYQGLAKKMKKIGLWAYYKIDDDLHSFVKKVMAIVLLKPTLMDKAYQLLFNHYIKAKKLRRFVVQLTKFMFYFEKQWMKPKIRTMISFYEVDFKTNNWSESYNSVLQRRAQKSHLSIWNLLELLITEETAVRMKHFQFQNGKRKYINKSVRDNVIEINEKIIEINEKFEKGEIELDNCLLSLSTLVGVKYDRWRRKRKKNERQKRKKHPTDNDC